jgi:hypothetical protein
MTAKMAFRASIFLTVGVAALKIFGIAQISWWWLLWPFWIAIPAYVSLVAFFIVLAAIKMGPPPS